MSFNSLGKYGATWFIVNVKKKICEKLLLRDEVSQRVQF